MNTEPEMTSLTDTHQSDTRDSSLKKQTHATTKNWKRFFLDTWRFEIVAWTFSVACFVAICTLLRVYENKVRPQLAHDLSFNAIISALATGCKSALALVIAEAVCQLKWHHFRGPTQQKLSGMQEFDDASRGPLGSVIIIWLHQAQSLVCLGAAVTVILLAFEPFMQQVISYPVLPVKLADGQATAKQLHGAFVKPSDFNNLTFNQATQMSINMQTDFEAAWGRGLWSSDEFKVAPVCSSGNCTWEEFTSAGICSQCSDMTASSVVDCKLPGLNSSYNGTCQIKIPGAPAYTFSVTGHLQDNLTTAEFTLPDSVVWRVYDNEYAATHPSLARHVTLGGMRFPIAAYGYAEIAFSAPHYLSLFKPSAISIGKLTVCGLGDCLSNYNISMSNGQASIQIGTPEFGMRHNKRPYNLTGLGTTKSKFSYYDTEYDFTSCWVPDNKSKADFAYCVPWFNSSLPYISETDFGFIPASNTQRYFYYNGSSQGYGGQADYFIDRIDNIGFEKIMSNVAASFTKLQLEKTKGTFSGIAHSSEVFVKVKWEWMILPGFLVLTGSLFFIATMAVNRKAKMPLWKSSALASFYHGLEKQEEDSLITALSMEVEAENSKVRLSSSDDDGRLLLRRESLEFDNPPSLPDPDLTPQFGSSSAHEDNWI